MNFCRNYQTEQKVYNYSTLTRLKCSLHVYVNESLIIFQHWLGPFSIIKTFILRTCCICTFTCVECSAFTFNDVLFHYAIATCKKKNLNTSSTTACLMKAYSVWAVKDYWLNDVS